MGAVVYLIQLIGLNDWLTLLIQIPTGVVLYVGGSVLFHMESYEYVLNAAKEYLHKKEK
jgi:hypothetical protein